MARVQFHFRVDQYGDSLRTRRRRLQALSKMKHLLMLVLWIRYADPLKGVSSEVPHVRGRNGLVKKGLPGRWMPN